MDAFTILSTVELNNKWLKIMNYTDIKSVSIDDDDPFDKCDGLCENIH